MTCARSLMRAAAALLGGFGLAAPAAAHISAAAPAIGPGSGRAGASVAAVVRLIGAVIGGLPMRALCSDLELQHVEKVGHWVQQEALEVVNGHLLAWLERFGR